MTPGVFRQLPWFRVLLLAAGIPFVAGCATTAGDLGAGKAIRPYSLDDSRRVFRDMESVPDLSRLRARSDAFYAAMGARDAVGMYQIEAPDHRARTSLVEYRQRLEKEWSAEPQASAGAVLKKVCSCETYGERATCFFVFSGGVVGLAGQERKDTKSGIWKYAEGEWFHEFTLPGDNCPDPTPGRGVAQMSSVPDEARFRARFQSYYEAMESGDFITLYWLIPAKIREGFSLEEYKSGVAGVVEEPRAKMNAEIVGVCSCSSGVGNAYPSTVRCLFLVDFALEEAGGRRERASILDAWDYEDGEWFHFFAGQGDECP